jgi:G3E family GTPase
MDSAVSNWLAYLRGPRGADLLRVKGILDLRDEQTPVVIHGVHHVFQPPVALTRFDTAARASCSSPAASRAKRCWRHEKYNAAPAEYAGIAMRLLNEYLDHALAFERMAAEQANLEV